jgi:signal peptidase II
MHQGSQAGKFFLPAIIIICSIIMADQYSKWYVMENMLREGTANHDFYNWFMSPKKVPVFVTERDHFRTLMLLPQLNLVMVWNQGISFGLFNTSAEWVPLAFIALSLAVSAGMVFWLALNTHRITALALGFITGGALGNVIDRVRFNAVADFIDFHLGEHHWPAFNVADSSIVFGAFLLMLGSLLSKREEERN